MGNGPATDPYKRPFETILDGALILDATTARIVLANKAAAEMFGFASREDMVGLNPLDNIPDDDRNFVAVLLAQGLEMDRPAPAEIRVRTKDGRVIWGSVTSALTEHEGRKATLITIREITSEKAKESALRDAEQQYKSLFDGMLDGAAVLDTATSQVVLANRAAARMFGFVSPEEMVGQNPLDYMPEEERERAARLVADGIERGSLPPTEIRFRTKQGRLLWGSVSVSLIEHQGRRASLATIRDVTFDKARDAALTEAERQYERLFDGMLDGAVVLDVSTFEIVLANKAAAEMFGFASPSEAVGLNPLRYIPEEDRDGVARLIALNLEGKATNPAEIRVLTTDKRERWVSASATRVDFEGRTAILSTLRDITEDKLKDAALKAAEESKLRLMDAASEAITIVQDGKLVYVNPAVAKGAGISQQQLIGLSFMDLVHPDEKHAVWERYQRILAGEWTPDTATIKGVDVNGQTLWSEIREIPFTWQGRPAVMSLIHDVTDRVRAEEGRKEKEERLRTIVENAWDGISIFDEDFRVQFESPSIARMTGYTPEEWTGSRPEAFNVHPDDLPSLVSTLESLKGQPGAVVRDFKIRYRHRDGSWRWIEATGQNLLHDPKVKGIVVNFRDITDSMKAEEALKASEERFRTLIEKATDVVIVLDASGKITYQSPSLERVTGYGYNEWLDKPLGELLIHPDDMPSLAAVLERVLAGPGATFEGITARYQHKDGSWHTLEATVTNMLHDPKVNGLVANFRDITDRKLAQEALAESEQKHRVLVENSSDVIFSVDPQGYFTYVSPAIERISGYRVDEVVGTSFVRFVLPEDLPGLMASFEKTLGGASEPAEFRGLRKDGAVRYLRTTSRVTLREGLVVGITGVMSDITERKGAEEALRRSEALLRDTEELAAVGGWEYDVETGVMVWTDETYRIHEIPTVPTIEHVTESLKCYPPPARQVVEEAFRKCVKEGIPYDLELPFVTFRGNQRWVRTTAKAIREGNRIVRIVGNIANITDRKEAEEALKESEAKYRRLFESTQTAMEIISMETGLVMLANQATARMFGFASPEDLVGEDSMKYLRPEDVGWVSTKMAQAVSDNTWQEIAELPVRTKDGRWLWISGMAIQSEYQGKPALLISLLDISRRKQAEQTLRESEEKFRLLTEKTNDVIYTTDLDFNDTYVSPSVEKILGFAPEEYLGRSADQRMTLESLAHAQEALLEHLSLEKDPKADPNRTVRIELEYYHKNGSTVWLEHQVSGLRDADGLVIGLHGVARDVTERRKAQKALRDSEAIYKRLFENTQTAMEVVSGETGLVVLANETTAKMFGFDSADDLVGVDSMEYLLPEDRDRVATEMARAIANKDRGGATELSVRTRDGRWLWINALVTYTEYEGKTSLLISLVDLTSRKQAEEKLKESEEKYRFLAERTNDIIWTSDLNLHTNYVSPSVEKLVGFTPEERLKQSVSDQMTPESLARAAEALAEHIALEKDPTANPNRMLRIELEYYRKDGSTVWLENQVSGVRDANGTLIGFHGVARDVSERRRAEQALRASEEKYRLVAESTNDEIWTSDINLNTTYVSPSVEKLLGFTVEERMKQDVMAQMTPESFARAAEMLKYHLALEEDPKADPNRVLRIELEYYRKDGSTVWLENQVGGIRDASGKLIGFHGVARDVTDRRRAEQALRERLKELQCVANISRLAERPEMPIEEFVQEAVGLLPPAWQYPEVCGARIVLDSKQFKTANYRETDWSQSADITVDEKRFGTVMVCYLQEMPEADEGPFLKEERALINTVADFLGHVIQHRQMEKYLRASETKYRDLFDHTLLGTEVIDGETGKIVLANHSMARIFGFKSPAEMIGANPLDHVMPEDVEWVGQQMLESIADPQKPQQPVTIRATTKDGRSIWVSATGSSFVHEGRPSMLLSLVDVTDRVRIQEALEASEAHYRNLFEHTLLGMEVVDIQTLTTVLANGSLAHMFGFKSAADMIGTRPLDYVLPEDLEWVANQIAQVITDPSWDRKVNIKARTEDGRDIWVTGMATPFEYEGKAAILISLVDITAAKQAEDKLRESEEKNRLLIDNAAEGIIVVQDGVTRFFNRRCTEVTGRSSEELLAGSFLDLVHPEDREMVALNYMKRVAGEDIPNNYQFRIIDKEGNTRWLQVNGVRLNWEGKPATLTMLSDVTQRVTAEQAVRDSEERFRALIEKATDAVAVVDQTGKVLYYSPSLERVTGYALEEWLGRPFGAWNVHPDDLASMAVSLQEVLKEPGKALEGIRARYQHKDGSWHTLEATVRNLLSDPKVNGLVANFRDITERVKAEESLRSSEERFRGLVETTSDWVWEIDPNSRYTYVSPRVRDILGYEPQEMLGHTPFQFMHQREGRRVSRILRRFSAEHLPFSLLENACTHKDGHSVVLETSAVPIIGSDGSFLGYRGIDRDITERKKVEQELQRSLKRLEKTMESTIEAITTTIETRDPYTTGHQMRVTDLACAIAKVMEVPPTQIEGIRVAGLLHDIGKIAIPTEILSKPGKLNEVEYEMIKTHSKVGYNILKKIEFPWPVARTVLQHHERWDGSGYPHGIRGEDILLEARILAVADVMEAMSSHRPYRPSMGADRALEEISQNSGIKYDPAVADACITAFTQAGFKFAPSMPGAAAEPESTPAGHPVDYLEDH